MILYYLATIASVLFMLAGAAVVGGYLYYFVYLRQLANAPDLSLAFTLYLVGHVLFLFRYYLITDLAHQIKETGSTGKARVLSAKRMGRPLEARNRYWYALSLDIDPDNANEQGFSTELIQLFGPRAWSKLEPGEILSVKYSRKNNLALIVEDDALVSIRR